MAMTKQDIAELIYNNMGLPKKECLMLVEDVFDIIKDELAKGNDVKVSGFGKWAVRAKKARRGRNPQSGEQITIEARSVVKFKPSPRWRG